MKFTVAGETFEQVDVDRLTLGEAAAIERVTGLTLAEISRKYETCVCAHYTRAHKTTETDTSCVICGCPEFTSIAPVHIGTALLWVAMKRQQPNLTFAQAEDIEQSEIEFIEVDEPDPTGATDGSTSSAAAE